MYIVIAIPAGATCRAVRIAALFVERSLKLPEIKSTRITRREAELVGELPRDSSRLPQVSVGIDR
jgi:hypothetical protein